MNKNLEKIISELKNKLKYNPMENIIFKLKNNANFFDSYAHIICEDLRSDDYTDESKYGILCSIDNYDELITNFPNYIILESPEEVVNECPHLTYDTRKIEHFDFLKSKNFSDQQILPWCTKENKPARICYCLDCILLPKNISPEYSFFFNDEYYNKCCKEEKQ